MANINNIQKEYKQAQKTKVIIQKTETILKKSYITKTFFTS